MKETQRNHACLSLIRKTNILFTIIISSQTESADSVYDTSGRMKLQNTCQHARVKEDRGDTWTSVL